MTHDPLLDLMPPNRRTPGRTLVMGILNVTPDSFSDGGRYLNADAAVRHGLRMAGEGADILDVGGESTRPGAEAVSADEEMARVLPVVEALARATNVAISIDTYKASVAREALRLGAHMVNDVSGLRFDPELAAAAAERDAYLVVMHSVHTPATMQQSPHYDDLLGEVCGFLRRQAAAAEAAGVRRSRILVDPGIGFGKTLEHNLELLRRLPEVAAIGYPVLVGVSRKSFIGRILDDAPPQERLEGTISASVLSVANGARVVRVHDVAPMVKAARVADAVLGRR